ARAHRAGRAAAPTERRRRAADAPPTGPFRPAPRVGPVRPIAPRVEAGAPVSPAPGPRNRSSTFYITMTVLAVVLFAIFLAVVVSVSG
ncbi:MAG: hypothetical protein L0H24_00705, partial [Microlunatus sp.]|nr:hypothetical protein [Microlunatus sp.]